MAKARKNRDYNDRLIKAREARKLVPSMAEEKLSFKLWLQRAASKVMGRKIPLRTAWFLYREMQNTIWDFLLIHGETKLSVLGMGKYEIYTRKNGERVPKVRPSTIVTDKVSGKVPPDNLPTMEEMFGMSGGLFIGDRVRLKRRKRKKKRTKKEVVVKTKGKVNTLAGVPEGQVEQTVPKIEKIDRHSHITVRRKTTRKPTKPTAGASKEAKPQPTPKGKVGKTKPAGRPVDLENRVSTAGLKKGDPGDLIGYDFEV